MGELFHLMIDSGRAKRSTIPCSRNVEKNVLHKCNVKRIKMVSKKREQYCNTVNAQEQILTKLIRIIVHVITPEFNLQNN